jgi:hypothetical protein
VTDGNPLSLLKWMTLSPGDSIRLDQRERR